MLNRSLFANGSGPSLPAFFALLAVVAVGTWARSQTVYGPSHSPQRPVHASHYGELPLAFEANRGQTDPSVAFLARGDGYTVFVAGSEAILALNPAAACAPTEARPAAESAPCPARSAGKQDVLRMKLLGARSFRAGDPNLEGEGRLPGRVNYFVGNDPSKWHADLPTYAKVRIAQAYRGIDLVYYGNHRQLEYDFVVAPGASAAAIRLQFAGAGDLQLSAEGNLLLKGTAGEAILRRPTVYQEKNGERRPVAARYRLLSQNTVGFAVESYDHTQALVIDPVLTYSTYLGGSGGDAGNGIAVDSVGSAYVVGDTYSTDFPVSDGAIQSQNNSTLAGAGPTVFITKLNPAGTEIVYSTYLGGSGGELGYGIATDSTGAAYITGVTYSSDFPVTCGAFQVTNNSVNGGSSAFVAKLNPAGDSLAYSTYLGGSGPAPGWGHGDMASAIAVDSSGNAYVAGTTPSKDFPVTEGAFQTQNNGYPKTNAFVTKLNPNGTSLVYSTYLGGKGGTGNGDFGNAIVLDSSEDAYVAGGTGSPDFPVTGGALQTSFGGSSNAFITKLNPTGAAEVYSTFLGNGGGASAYGIAVDSGGLAYVTGTIGSPTLQVTDGSIESESFATYFAGWPTSFVSKLSSDGSSLAYSTYLQGYGAVATSLAVDGAGTAYVAGKSSTQEAGSFGGFQSTADSLPVPGGTAAFVVKLNSSATGLNYATLFGGTSNPGDGANAVALDAFGNVYVTGLAHSTDLPTTTGAFQTSNHADSGGSNAFIAKFALSTEQYGTTYPAVPTDISTGMDQLDITWYQGSGLGGPTYLLSDASYSVEVLGVPSGVALTGTLSFTGPDSATSCSVNLTSANQNTACDSGVEDWLAPGTYTITASYSGDDNFLPSSTSGPINWPLYTDPSSRSLRLQLHPKAGQEQPSPAIVAHEKPVAPASVPDAAEMKSSDTLGKWSQAGTAAVPATPFATAAQGTAGCIAPGLTFLTVKVVSSAPSRLYGAANPAFSYSIAGLRNGDTVTVKLQTAATPASSVGSYPVTATVTGSAAANYNLRVENATLEVTPAPLTVTATNVGVNYGAKLPPLTAYSLSGFVNGDNTSVVSGAPVLSSSVTLTTPVGDYPIQASAGTLKATNYTFRAGGGSVHVYPAVLGVEPKNESMRYGQTPPHLSAYTLKGFVNGQGAGIVSGSPILSTSVKPSTPVGTYRIQAAPGTLKAPNYVFYPGQAVLIVNKAPLTVTSNDLTMKQGSALPKLTYRLSGFVNKQSASAVRGAPVLSTTATGKSKPGKYPITVKVGTLNAENYLFETAAGTLTVTP